LPLATLRMPPRTQQRDFQGYFIRDVQLQPIDEQPLPIVLPLPGPSEPNHLQQIIIAARIPTLSDVPVLENIVNIATAVQSLTNISTPLTSLPELSATLDPSICCILPPQYVTDPPLPHPDFEAPRTNALPQHRLSPIQAELSDNPSP